VAGEYNSHGKQTSPHALLREERGLKSLDGYIYIIMICSFLWADLFFYAKRDEWGTNGCE